MWDSAIGVYFAAGGFVVIIAAFVSLNTWIERSRKSKFQWQPELSHKLRVTSTDNNDLHITLIEKTPEERDEDRHEYLKAGNQ